MQLLKGAFGEDPADGILRGRVGVRHWVMLSCFLAFLALIDVVVVLVCIFSLKLVALVIFITVTVLFLTSCSLCGNVWPWLGIDTTSPVIFDLMQGNLEVQWSANGIFRRREWPVETVKDLRVYWAPFDTEHIDMVAANAKPLKGVDAVQKKLPLFSDVGCEFLYRLSSSRRWSRALVVVYLGASVRGERNIIRLSRNVWSVKDVEELLDLARVAREQIGLQHDLPPTVLGNSSTAPGALKGKEQKPVETQSAHKGVKFELDETQKMDRVLKPNGEDCGSDSADEELAYRDIKFELDETQKLDTVPELIRNKEHGDSDSADEDPHPQREVTQISGSDVVPGPPLRPESTQHKVEPTPAVASDSTIRVEQMKSYTSPLPRPKMKSKPKV